MVYGKKEVEIAQKIVRKSLYIPENRLWSMSANMWYMNKEGNCLDVLITMADPLPA